MSETLRFEAQVPYSKWPDASRCYELMIAGDWDGLQAHFAAHRQNVTDSIGAVNYWRAQFGAIPVAASSQQISHTPLDTTFPDKAMATAFQASVDGLGSASVVGNSGGVYGGVFDTVPETISLADLPYYGYDAFMGATIRTGQWLVVYSKATQTLQGRVDVRIP